MAVAKKVETKTVSKSVSLDERRLLLAENQRKQKEAELKLLAEIGEFKEEVLGLDNEFAIEVKRKEIEINQEIQILQEKLNNEKLALEANLKAITEEFSTEMNKHLSNFEAQKLALQKLKEKADYDNEILVRDNKIETAKQIAAKYEQELIYSSDKKSLEAKVLNAMKDKALAVEQAVQLQKESSNKQYSEKMQEFETQAKLDSLTLQNKDTQIEYLTNQLKELKSQLEAKDVRMVEMLKASNPNISVSSK